MKVRWALSAEQDRIDITDFIARDNPLAAIAMDELFAAAARRLAEHPLIGRPGLITGARELVVHDSYRMVYEVRDDTVWILVLVHTARMWPPRRG
ncbi:MAG: type II toxin-antitoxin system RelE/ParE family toxin [bacterium]|nr:type II toxin-antitoxin system RelE/ParE family toxin [Rhodocyclaceae bacterium]MCA3139243.1 type II toxin-antitoxin system RelE/ParE family toxin [Rhodocyclaceae bacterium]MCA4904693.1 type II toxin-antitoxin system RelE/ParE family toxin [Rhodocyclaceae bacterium]MCE2979898.1 type II toxin-antitoxin system RelE/ParE family toxin [Betaproteobacteria bacterium]